MSSLVFEIRSIGRLCLDKVLRRLLLGVRAGISNLAKSRIYIHSKCTDIKINTQPATLANCQKSLILSDKGLSIYEKRSRFWTNWYKTEHSFHVILHCSGFLIQSHLFLAKPARTTDKGFFQGLFTQCSHVQIFFLVERNLTDSSYILWNKFQDYQLRFILTNQFLVTA